MTQENLFEEMEIMAINLLDTIRKTKEFLNFPNELRAVNRNEQAKEKCDVCGCYPSVLIVTEFGTFCKEHARYV